MSVTTPRQKPPTQQPPVPEGPRTHPGDRVALPVWVGCVLLLASLLLGDLLLALLRLLC